ncbi:hypothetical protein KY289_001515 [Solanum tuberosum]|nr:hypothetical protein KY289_001515 [Solanum tuberosum]
MYVGFGETTHMTNISANLVDLQIYNGTEKIIVENGSQLEITHVGNLNKSGLKVKDILDKKLGTPLAKGSNAGGLYQLGDNNLFALTTTQDWKK